MSGPHSQRLLGTPVFAADMALKAPPPAPAPAWSWTGFYVGLNAGYGVANDPFNQVLSEPGFAATSSINSRVTPNGGLFGGQAGYNYQAGNIVVGVEGDIQWSGEHDTAGCGFQCVSEAGEVLTEGSAEQRIDDRNGARSMAGPTTTGYFTSPAVARGVGSMRRLRLTYREH